MYGAACPCKALSADVAGRMRAFTSRSHAHACFPFPCCESPLTVSHLEHLLPCRLQFLGACTKQKPYIVLTELMACSLADAFLKTFYAPTQRRQVEVALDFARGMAYLHSRRQPIVHRCGRGRCLACDLEGRGRCIACLTCTAGGSASCTGTWRI
jgi:hypothetical protein